jgi:hypothetical protein
VLRAGRVAGRGPDAAVLLAGSGPRCRASPRRIAPDSRGCGRAGIRQRPLPGGPPGPWPGWPSSCRGRLELRDQAVTARDRQSRQRLPANRPRRIPSGPGSPSGSGRGCPSPRSCCWRRPCTVARVRGSVIRPYTRMSSPLAVGGEQAPRPPGRSAAPPGGCGPAAPGHRRAAGGPRGPCPGRRGWRGNRPGISQVAKKGVQSIQRSSSARSMSSMCPMPGCRGAGTGG